MNVIEARDAMLEAWFIFSHTGEINDGLMLLDLIKKYDLALENQYGTELE